MSLLLMYLNGGKSLQQIPFLTDNFPYKITSLAFFANNVLHRIGIEFCLTRSCSIDPMTDYELKLGIEFLQIVLIN